MSKAELMGCIGTAGKADCEHYCPGEGKMVDGAMRYPGIDNAPMKHGRCLKIERMISRMDACPISGKSAKKQTKAEMWGCATCEYAKHYTVLCCELSGKYAAVHALHECPKTKQQALAKRRIEEWGQEEPPNWELTPKQREEFSGQAPQPELTEEKLTEKRMIEYGCKDCIHYNDSQDGHICAGQDPKSHNRLYKPISMVEVCPDRKTYDNPWSQTFCAGAIVPAGKERWDYRTLPGDVRAVDYWYDVGSKTVFETTCANLGDCRKARDRYFEAQAQKEIPKEESAPPPPSQTEEERTGCIGEACTKYEKSNIPNISATCNGKPGWSMGLRGVEKCPGPYPVEQSAPTPAQPMRILAFDAATTITGWALREGDRVIEHGSIRATGHDIEARKEQIREKVLHYCLNGQLLNVVMLERSFVAGSGNTTRLLCELQGIIKNCCHRMGYPIVEPSPTTWRAICPGSGKCDKDAAVEYARLKGYVFETADEAEAICMALSFSAELVKILDAEKEKKKNGKSKKESGGNHGSNGGKRRGVAAGIAVPAGAAKASQ